MLRFTRKQRVAVILLAIFNLLAVVAIAVAVRESGSTANNAHQLPTPDREQSERCTQAITQALLDAAQLGLVQTQQSGTILIHLERSGSNDHPRLTTDSAVWAAFEAIAQQSDCLGFGQARVEVTVSAPEQATDHPPELRAVAIVQYSDLVLWGLGEIDDEELASRVEYHPLLTPTSQQAPAQLRP
jgi:hypothetical protein